MIEIVPDFKIPEGSRLHIELCLIKTAGYNKELLKDKRVRRALSKIHPSNTELNAAIDACEELFERRRNGKNNERNNMGF